MNGSGFLLALLMPQGSSRNIWNSAWKELETNSVFLILTISLFLVQISSRIYNIFSTVLQRLRSKEPTKCDLFKHQIKYLGQKQGYCVDTSNFRAIYQLRDSKPTTVGDIRRIIGFLNYYRKYIQNFRTL